MYSSEYLSSLEPDIVRVLLTYQHIPYTLSTGGLFHLAFGAIPGGVGVSVASELFIFRLGRHVIMHLGNCLSDMVRYDKIVVDFVNAMYEPKK